ncbi:hypothetical protein T459_15527 [Capsicum annuum]|uniref:Peptidase M28 domain-containing protein n=1 Tax=Capsicum annuum TaxID=4072 RepID=A0A2G2ZKK0_CAPAN|nr:hypothetical protein T459_15527 [Capsicum annuum]
MPLSGVQVGSVYDGIGDPTTPGWPSTGECERLSDKEVENKGNVPLIPSLLISSADGDAIIRTIGGKVVNVDWQGGEDNCTKARKTAENRVEAAKNNRLMQLGRGGIGSAEWVEENREMLAARVVAYLNVDCAVQGGPFRASATPHLDDIIIEAAQQVQDPDNSSQTIYQSWLASDNDTTLGRLGGAGSDYAAFVQHIGTPALDMSFGNGYPVYHSMYDDTVWMKKFGDPMFHRHAAVASIWGLVAVRLVDDEVLSFNYISYAIKLQKSAEGLEGEISDNGISLVPLYASIEKLRKAAKKIKDDIKALRVKRRRASVREVRERNDRLIMTERAFTDRDGLPSRTWYKHLTGILRATSRRFFGAVGVSLRTISTMEKDKEITGSQKQLEEALKAAFPDVSDGCYLQ